MAELEIEGTFDEQWGVVKSTTKQLHAAIHGNGQEGILSYVTGLRAQFRLLLILVTIFGVLSAFGTFSIAALEYNRQVQHNLLNAPKIFLPDRTGQVENANNHRQVLSTNERTSQ